jgi:glutamate racemase
MTTVQALALVAVLVAVALTYLPHGLKIPVSNKSKPSILKQIEAIVEVKEANSDAAVISACNALLQALLQVKV